MRINCNFLEFMELKNYIFIKASLNESILKIGQVLNIGNKNIFRNIESKKRTILYSVKQGDNLSKISKLFNVSIKTIKQDNDNLDIIRPGQILKITIKAF